MPASYASLEALLVGRNKTCQSTRELDHALTELEDRGLIGWDREANRYDAHPIVRGVVWKLTETQNQRAVYAALEAHFEPMTVPDSVETLAELAPAIERYHTLLGLGRYDDAVNLFWDRLDHPTLFRLAAHRERISWLERLFPDGIERLPALTKDRDKHAAMDGLAQSYQLSGQPGRAARLYKSAIEVSSPKSTRKNAYITNLGTAYFEMGALCEADHVLRQSLVANQRDEENHRDEKDYVKAATLAHLGRLLTIIGNKSLSLAALIRSKRFFIDEENIGAEAFVDLYLADHALQFGSADNGLLLSQTWKHEEAVKDEGYSSKIALLRGQFARIRGEFAQADEYLHQALSRARAVNITDFELQTLLAIAELELQRGRPIVARDRLSDVWEPVERGPYPLHKADAYNVLAAITLAEGDKLGSIEAAVCAYKIAWCDGPPYAYYQGLQKAKARLAILAAPEPEMPPFDFGKFGPLPKVEINPMDQNWVDPDKLS